MLTTFQPRNAGLIKNCNDYRCLFKSAFFEPKATFKGNFHGQFYNLLDVNVKKEYFMISTFIVIPHPPHRFCA